MSSYYFNINEFAKSPAIITDGRLKGDVLHKH